MDATVSVKYEPEECAWCKGTRKGRDGERCQVCKGRGAVLVAQPSRMCVPCRGSGREGGFSDQPVCPVCGGSGWQGVYQSGS
jgi:DnaJ-class molecular chaperone